MTNVTTLRLYLTRGFKSRFFFGLYTIANLI